MTVDVTAQALLGGVWTDLTADCLYGHRVAIRRGAASESSVAPPAEASFSLRDAAAIVSTGIAGTYDPYNPVSPYYGEWAEGTQIRVYRGTPHLGEGGGSGTASTSQVAPSVTATEDGLLCCMWLSEGPVNITVPVSMTGLTERDGTSSTSRAAYESETSGATGTRTATSSGSQEYASVSVFLHGANLAVEDTQSSVSATQDDITLTTPSDTEADWWLIALQGWTDEVSAMPDVPYGDVGGWILLGDSDEIEAGATNLRVRGWVRRANRAGAQDVIFGGRDEDATADNHAALIVVSGDVTDWDFRLHGEVSSIQHDWTHENDVRADVTASGLLRRLQQGSTPLQSAAHRYIMAGSPTVYWPFTDGKDATEARPAVGSGSNLFTYEETAASFQFGSGELAPWLPPVLLVRNTFVLEALIGSVPAPTSSMTVDVVRRAQGADDDAAFGSVQFVRASDNGSGTEASYYILGEWVAGVPTVTLNYLQHGAGGAVLDTGSSTDAAAFWDDQMHHWRIELTEDGADIDVVAYLDGVAVMSGTHSGYGLRAPKSVAVDGSFVRETHVGFVLLWMDDDAPNVENLYRAITGHQGETAGRRFERLCKEAGVAVHIIGDPDDTEPMGPQTTDALVPLLRSCEATDMGIMYEPREALALGYRTRVSLLNQPATLTAAYGDLVGPLNPAADDRYTRNDVTATRRAGSSARTVVETGPKGSGTVGRYDTSITVDPETDDRLDDLAAWQAHLGTVAERRFPQLPAEVHAIATAATARAFRAVDIGDRIEVTTNLPARLQATGVDQVALGYTEVLTGQTHTWAANTAPSSAYEVLELDTGDDNQSRLAVGDSTTNEALDTTETGVDVISDTPWADSAGYASEFPFDVVIGGERMTVTACTGTGLTQVFTVTRSVNGVVKSHDTGTAIQLFRPSVLSL